MSWPDRTHTLPDGRELRAAYEGEPVGWIVHVVGHENKPVAGRDIHDALVDLLEPGPGQWPDWFMEAANDLAARDTPLGRRYACPCCGYLTLDEAPAGTYNICKVCFWEDDGVQFRDPNYEGGANKVSLNQARRNFHEHGVSETRFKSSVRPPLPEEHPSRREGRTSWHALPLRLRVRRVVVPVPRRGARRAAEIGSSGSVCVTDYGESLMTRAAVTVTAHTAREEPTNLYVTVRALQAELDTVDNRLRVVCGRSARARCPTGTARPARPGKSFSANR